MAARVPLSVMYRGARERLSDLVRAHPEADDRPMPATPGWSVHDVIAHLVGAGEDLIGGWRPTGGITEEWTAGHVARGRGIPTAELLTSWEKLGPELGLLMDSANIWPLAFDVGSHEQDVRAALGAPGARDSDVVVIGAKVLLGSLQVPQPLAVETENGEVRVGPAGDGPATLLRTTAFEAFRWRMGRRSREQLAAMDWTGDPAPFLEHLCVFGPAAGDVVE